MIDACVLQINGSCGPPTVTQSRFELQAAAALLGHKAFILGRLTFAAFRIEPPEPSFHHHGAVP